MITNKQIATAFKQAKKLLKKSKYQAPVQFVAVTPRVQYICWALTNSGYFAHRSQKVTHAAKQIVQDRLVRRDGSLAMSVEGWLSDQLGIHSDLLKFNEVQAHRHAWMDMLIKEFDKPGNFC